MARLPQPGADHGTWGDVLNDFLSQSLKSDGAIKDNAVTANTIAPNSVTSSALASNAVTAAIIQDGTITEALLDSALRAKVNAGAVTSVNTKTGAVTLAKSDVGLGNVDNTSDADKNSAIVTLTNKTLTDPKITNIHDTNGNEMLTFVPAANAANHLQFYNATAGGEVAIRATGDDTNVNFVLRPKGTGAVVFRDSSNMQIAAFSGATSAVNRFVFTSSASGNALVMQAAGTDTDVSINIMPRGAGTLQSKGVDVVTTTNTQTLSAKTLNSPRISGAILDGNGNSLLSVGAVASAVNYLYVSNQASGSAPGFTAVGADTNISMSFAPKGAGTVSIWTATGSTPTLAAAGQDSNQDLALVPKGNGVVKLGGGAAIPQGGVLSVYNTSDQTTNYERARFFWQSNVFIIDGSEAGGTGTQRSMTLRAQGKAFTIAGPGGAFDMAVTTGGNGVGLRVQGTNSATSGTPAGIGLVWTMNQTGTAGYTGLSMNVTETATGSGPKNLIDAQVGGTSKFKVDNTGAVTIAAVGTGSGSVVTTDGAQTLTNKTISGLSLTGAVSLPQSSVFQMYSTADETTNYERFRQYWTGTTLMMATESAGTGLARPIQINGAASYVTLAASGITIGRSTTVNASIVSMTATLTATSGVQVMTNVVPTISQSGTAGYTALLVNPNESTTGSGTKNLIDAQVGGSSKFRVDTNGKVTLNNGPIISAGVGSPEGAVSAPVGSLYTRTDGGPGSTLYIKESGTGNTGWTAK